MDGMVLQYVYAYLGTLDQAKDLRHERFIERRRKCGLKGLGSAGKNGLDRPLDGWKGTVIDTFTLIVTGTANANSKGGDGW